MKVEEVDAIIGSARDRLEAEVNTALETLRVKLLAYEPRYDVAGVSVSAGLSLVCVEHGPGCAHIVPQTGGVTRDIVVPAPNRRPARFTSVPPDPTRLN